MFPWAQKFPPGAPGLSGRHRLRPSADQVWHAGDLVTLAGDLPIRGIRYAFPSTSDWRPGTTSINNQNPERRSLQRASRPAEKVMPSASLQHWVNDRVPRLTEIEAQCAYLSGAGPVQSTTPRRESDARHTSCYSAPLSRVLPRPLHRIGSDHRIQVRTTLRILIQAGVRPIAPSTTATPTCRT